MIFIAWVMVSFESKSFEMVSMYSFLITSLPSSMIFPISIPVAALKSSAVVPTKNLARFLKVSLLTNEGGFSSAAILFRVSAITDIIAITGSS